MKKNCIFIIILAMFCCCSASKQTRVYTEERTGTSVPATMSPKPEVDVKINISPIRRPTSPI